MMLRLVRWMRRIGLTVDAPGSPVAGQEQEDSQHHLLEDATSRPMVVTRQCMASTFLVDAQIIHQRIFQSLLSHTWISREDVSSPPTPPSSRSWSIVKSFQSPFCYLFPYACCRTRNGGRRQVARRKAEA